MSTDGRMGRTDGQTHYYSPLRLMSGDNYPCYPFLSEAVVDCKELFISMNICRKFHDIFYFSVKTPLPLAMTVLIRDHNNCICFL